MDKMIIGELLSLVKWLVVVYFFYRVLDICLTDLEEKKTKSAAVLIKASGIVFEDKMKKFVDFLIREMEDKKPQE